MSSRWQIITSGLLPDTLVPYLSTWASSLNGPMTNYVLRQCHVCPPPEHDSGQCYFTPGPIGEMDFEIQMGCLGLPRRSGKGWDAPWEETHSLGESAPCPLQPFLFCSRYCYLSQIANIKRPHIQHNLCRLRALAPPLLLSYLTDRLGVDSLYSGDHPPPPCPRVGDEKRNLHLNPSQRKWHDKGLRKARANGRRSRILKY